MIICSCNVLSEAQILDALKGDDGSRPLSAGQAYRCLGCAPRCGRCIETVRAMAAQVHVENCSVGCPACPAHRDAADIEQVDTPYLIAAE